MSRDDAVVRAIIGYANAGLSPQEICGDLGLVMAWRVWRGGDETRPELLSIARDVVWPERRALVAKCNIKGFPRPVIAQLKALGAQKTLAMRGYGWHEDEEQAPAFGCSCGIYAVPARTETLLSYNQLHWRWIGPVALWGTVVEHKGGYRASRAYPLRLESAPHPPGPRANGTVKVLLVDPRGVIRRCGVRALWEKGYCVFEARCAKDALGIVRCPTRIDLLIAASELPDLDGASLYRLARDVRPNLKFIDLGHYADTYRNLPTARDFVVQRGRVGKFVDEVRRVIAPRRAASKKVWSPFDHPLARAYGVPVSVGHPPG